MPATRIIYNSSPLCRGNYVCFCGVSERRRILKTCGDVWPIDQSAGKRPEGWPQWPSGNEFAFILTHDVESKAGLDKVRQLAELEMELGFRSSFNFVPEGDYVGSR